MARVEQRLDEPRLQPADVVVADLQLSLRGVVLPWRELGGSLSPTRLGPTDVTAPSDRVRVRVAPALAAQVHASGRLVITDRENCPIGALAEATIEHSEFEHSETETWVEGCPVPCGALPNLLRRGGSSASAIDSGRDRLVVICQRPLLRAEVIALRSEIASGVDVLIIVPDAGPTPDQLPAQVLGRSLRRDLPDIPDVSLPIAWRERDSDLVLARATATAFGASRLQVMGSDDPVWRQLVADLQHTGHSSMRESVSADTWAELTRWRPPRQRRGLVVFFTGLSGSGKSTLARMLVTRLEEASDRSVSLLDGDDIRRLLSSGLGFDRASRDLNIERIGFVASEIARSGGIAVCAPIAPYAVSRAAVRARAESVGDLVLVHLSTPLEECERRDVKGLYAQARAGLITEFTGVSDPYEVPTDAELTIDTATSTPAESAAAVMRFLRRGGWLADPHPQETEVWA
jgi:sulfate adenylyltransferase